MVPLHDSLTAIAFDLDETLYDREAAFRRLVADWLGPLPDHTLTEIVERDGRGYSPREEFFSWMAAAWPHTAADGRTLWDRFRAELPRFVEPDPAAVPLLAAVSAAGWRTGVLTNGASDYQLAKLHATGLAGHFPPGCVLVSEAVGTAKPHAAAFTALTDALGTPAHRILYVGDHAENDMRGARQAGLRTCWLRRRDAGKTCASADLVIDSLSELRPLLFPS